MPNHVHLIVVIEKGSGRQVAAPFGRLAYGSKSCVIELEAYIRKMLQVAY